ncbi:MAG: bifunctional riboflavin kinase/FAD synthetase [bacterium]|nr:bifunctional riboflavin kinase/FAD synthetase [bacterium]
MIRHPSQLDPNSPRAVAIGVFDGVHRGHRVILDALVAEARSLGGTPVVLTFEPHPESVVRPGEAPAVLTPLPEKAALMADRGVECLLALTFDRELARMPAETFAVQLVGRQIAARVVLVGFNFRFGGGGAGDVELLEQWGKELGYRVRVVPPVREGDTVISSSGVREALSAGRLDEVGRMLGRNYTLVGRVVPGDGRGRTLGFPTANLELWDNAALPGPGVYVVDCRVDGAARRGVLNVGRRPTFGGGPVKVEAHLLDYEGSLYGQRIRVELLARLRGEEAFPGAEPLRSQIRADAESARAWRPAGAEVCQGGDGGV